MICPACKAKTKPVSKGPRKGMEKCPRCRMFWPPDAVAFKEEKTWKS